MTDIAWDNLPTGLLNIAKPLNEVFDLALIDLDGVAYRGPEPIPNAASGIAKLRQKLVTTIFVTNNASREPGEIAAQLTSLDIPTSSDEILTAAQACASFLGEYIAPGSKVLVVGGQGLHTAVNDAGYRIVTSADDNPAAVAQGFSPHISWKDLAEAAYAVAGGAKHVASNRDLSLPTARGFAPGNGTLVQAVSTATGIEPVSAGKPSPTMYHIAVAAHDAKHVLVIGDRLDTDLAGARSGGYVGLLVLTGVSTARDAILAPAQLRPHVIIEDLGELDKPHRIAQRIADEHWQCGEYTARIDGGELVIDGPNAPDHIDAARAAAQAVWEAADKGEQVDPNSIPEFHIGRLARP